MKKSPVPVTILIADDDEEDRELARRALIQSRLANNLMFVEDGEELLEYLSRKGRYADPGSAPTPGLILLDLKMPRVDGFEALRAIKQNERLRHIPIVALTTSDADEDIARTYTLGVNSFIQKPVTFSGLVQAMTTIGKYWFELVELPEPVERGG